MFKKLFVLFVVFTLVSGLALYSEEKSQSPKKKVKRGAEVTSIQGVTRSWSDVRKISLDKLNIPRKMRPVLNFKSPKTVVKQSAKIDPVVQDSHPIEKKGIKAVTNTIKNFEGMNFSANGSGWPPDVNGDVGMNYYVQTVNTSIAIYHKSTGALHSATTFDSFFGGTGISGTPCDSNNNGDPIVLYDRYAQRWFLLDFAWATETDGSFFAVAVSKTSDPTGDWWQYALRTDDTLLSDYPKCGIWHDGIYVTANMFEFLGSWQGAKMWSFKKPDIYNGTLTTQSITDSSNTAWSIVPANAKSPTSPSASAPNYMYAMDCDEWGAIDSLYVWEYDVDWSNPANTTWTGPSTIPTASFELDQSATVPQLGTPNQLDAMEGRLMSPAMYRNFGSHESVYICHTVDYSDRRAIRWYEININGGVSSILQQGTYSPDSTHRWMGSIGADANGYIAIGYSASSSTMYPSIRYAGHSTMDSLGQMSSEKIMTYGSGSQTSYERWGDYSSISIDPFDDRTFWYTQEYYSASGVNWKTRIGSFKVTLIDLYLFLNRYWAEMHIWVHPLDLVSYRYAEVIYEVYDTNGSPVANAQVTGNWSGVVEGKASAYTNAKGQAMFKSESTKDTKGYFKLSIDNVSHRTVKYNAKYNKVKPTVYLTITTRQ
ncbi:MAG: hypothetical protein GY757_04280 [bacterium]|nr:hypothetical protein [bacterium]